MLGGVKAVGMESWAGHKILVPPTGQAGQFQKLVDPTTGETMWDTPSSPNVGVVSPTINLEGLTVVDIEIDQGTTLIDLSTVSSTYNGALLCWTVLDARDAVIAGTHGEETIKHVGDGNTETITGLSYSTVGYGRLTAGLGVYDYKRGLSGELLVSLRGNDVNIKTDLVLDNTYFMTRLLGSCHLNDQGILPAKLRLYNSSNAAFQTGSKLKTTRVIA